MYYQLYLYIQISFNSLILDLYHYNVVIKRL